jgi:predicted nuclease with TOPRIM domain
MKSYDELKAEMEAIQQQMVEAKKNECTDALKEVKRLCKEFGLLLEYLKAQLQKVEKLKTNKAYLSSKPQLKNC